LKKILNLEVLTWRKIAPVIGAGLCGVIIVDSMLFSFIGFGLLQPQQIGTATSLGASHIHLTISPIIEILTFVSAATIQMLLETKTTDKQ